MKKITLLLLIFNLSLSKSAAQNIDSLKLALKNAKHDTTRCNVLSQLSELEPDEKLWPLYNDTLKAICEKYLASNLTSPLRSFYLKYLAGALNNVGYLANQQGDISTALDYYHRSLKISEEIKDKEGIAYSLNNIGYIYVNQGDIPKALEYYHRSLKIREEIKDKQGIAQSLNNIGYIYDNQGDLPKALDYYHRSLKIREEIKDKKGIANTLTNIGYIYRYQGDHSKALDYYQRSLSIMEEIKDKQGIASSLNNIGLIYSKQGDIPKALDYYHRSLKIQEEIKDKQGIATSLNNIGIIFQNQGDLPTALDYYNRSLTVMEEIKDKQGIAYCLNSIAKAMLQTGLLIGARDYAERGLKIAQELGYPENIQRSSWTLSKIYSKTGNWKGAYEMQVLFKQMSDSINNEANKKASLQKQFQYEYEKKAAADSVANAKANEIKNAQIAKQQAELKAKRNQQYALYGGLIIVVLFLGFIYNRLQITRKQKGIIEEQKEVVEKAHHELEEKNHEILQSITYAKRLQQSILPPPRLVKEYMKDSFVLYMPKDIVAGDFYWIESHNNKIYFAAADCTGHGVPGAMVSMVCHNALNRALLEFGLLKPAQILDKASELVDETFSKSEDNVQDGMDISLYCLDTQTRELEWAGANNPLWIIPHLASPKGRNTPSPKENGLGDEVRFIEIKADKQPVGRYENRKPFTNHTIQLNEGDSLFSITDGYADQFGGEQGKKYTYKKLREFLLSMNNKPMTLQKDELIAEFEKWRGNNEQVDDVCIIGVKV
jgi:serine phosphatase RsbU (regulator of sigma subunit)/Tfp pilus assembly protein PilF